MATPHATMTRIVVRETARRGGSFGFVARAVPGGFQSVCGPHAQGAEYYPADQPEQIEWDAKRHWMNAVPKRDRKAHCSEGNKAEQQRTDRW
jgi:hypothetical protein